MGKRSEYAPGTFCWVDLATTDAAGAKAFYGGLLGWTPVETQAGEAGTYSMLQLGGDTVAALYELEDATSEQSMAPSWLSYVSVDDADEVAGRVRELGGTVHGEPFDVMSAGRMALLQDPTGAMFAAWQPGDHAGAERVNDPGCLTWNDLVTSDTAAAAAFYGELFSWEVQAVDAGGGPPYVVISNGERPNGGITALREEQAEVPAHWLPYFALNSCEAALARAGELGGVTLGGPVAVPAGRIGILRDPQGASFAVFEGDTDD